MVNKKQFGLCRLCLDEDVQLRKSHILPEFFYKPTYDQLGRTIPISTDRNVAKRPIQKGIREHLLCAKCELKLSKAETYVARLLKKSMSIENVNLFDEGLTIDSVNHSQLKLFQLMNLWRASISSHSDYSDVKLGKHEEVIRKLLLADNPGPFDEYICFISLLYTKARTDCKEMVLPFESYRKDNARIFRLIGGGCLWIYIVGSKSAIRQQGAHKAFSKRTNGDRLIVPIALMEDQPMIHGALESFRDAGTLSRPLF